MKNKVLLILVFVLALVLIGQAIYIAKLQKAQAASRRALHRQQPQVRMQHNPEQAYQPVVTWDPFREMEMAQARMDRAFEDNMRQHRNMARQREQFEPRMDIRETGKAYLITMDLPGMDKDAINIEVNGRLLTVSGQRSEEENVQEKGYFRQEASFGHFSRTVTLPAGVKAQDIAAAYNNGVLKVEVAKTDQEKQPQVEKIKIKIK